ncbi:hypothetical protein QJQ45_026832, partial [Haematococcus lacustris]
MPKRKATKDRAHSGTGFPYLPTKMRQLCPHASLCDSMQKHASLGRCQRSGQMQIVSRRVSQGLLALAHSAPTPFTSRLLACQTAHPSAWRLPAHAPSTDAPSQDFAGFPITHYDVRFQNMMMASGQLEYGLRVQNGPNGRIGTGVLNVYNSGKEPDRFYIELARPAMIDRALSLARPKCLVHVQGALRRDDVQTASGETETRFVIEADMASASIVVVSDSGPRRDGISAGPGQSSNPSQPYAQLNNMAMPGSFAASAPVAAARVPGPTSPAHTSFAGGPTPPDANSRLETLDIEQQWAHVAAYPHMWWDNRKNKLNPRGPDFKLRDKSHNVALWVDREVHSSGVMADNGGWTDALTKPPAWPVWGLMLGPSTDHTWPSLAPTQPRGPTAALAPGRILGQPSLQKMAKAEQSAKLIEAGQCRGKPAELITTSQLSHTHIACHVLWDMKAAATGSAAAAAHAVGLTHIGKGIAEQREFVFDPATQIGTGTRRHPGSQCSRKSVGPGVRPASSRPAPLVEADQGQVRQASGLNNARRTTQRWLAPIQPHLKHLAAASSAGTSLEANLKHITVTLATWDAFLGGVPRPQVGTAAAEAVRRQGLGAGAVLQDVAPRKPPQAACSSQAATQSAASEPGPSTPPPAKRNKRTKAEQEAEPTQPTKGKGKGKGKAARAKPAPQPGRWLDRDCNAALNMQRIGKSRWRPLELCYWP